MCIALMYVVLISSMMEKPTVIALQEKSDWLRSLK
jgi:hypothetical protein